MWDTLSALARAGGDRVFLAELVALFLTYLPSQLQVLDEAIANGDMTAAERGAHSLAGATANLSANAAGEAARGLLALARAKDMTGIRSAWPAAKKQYTRLQTALAEWHVQQLPAATGMEANS
jgi:HPt (histidine-containing phosphotransfer) domain-containing protein